MSEASGGGIENELRLFSCWRHPSNGESRQKWRCLLFHLLCQCLPSGGQTEYLRLPRNPWCCNTVERAGEQKMASPLFRSPSLKRVGAVLCQSSVVGFTKAEASNPTFLHNCDEALVASPR